MSRFYGRDTIVYASEHYLKNQRLSNCSPTVDFGLLKLTSDRLCGNRVIKMKFSSTVTCAPVVWFFETILLNIWWALSVNIDFLPLFFFADVIFPWFVYVDITLEIVALYSPNIMAVFITDPPAIGAPTICHHWKLENSPIFRFFHTEYHSTQSLMHWHEHYRV
jgi:hypothetical protein